MSLETINLIKDRNIAVIKLNRPDLLNAVNEQLVWDFQNATESVKDDSTIRSELLLEKGGVFVQVLI